MPLARGLVSLVRVPRRVERDASLVFVRHLERDTSSDGKRCVFSSFSLLVGGKEEILPLDFPCLRTTAKHTASIPRAVCVLREVRRNLSPFLAPRNLGTKERGSLPSRLFPALIPRLMLTRLRPTASNALPPPPPPPPAHGGRGGKSAGGHECRRKQTFLKTSHLVRFPLNNFKFFELSFQSSLQLSLAVLVCYRSFAGIFSLGWNLPPVLGLHSQTTRLGERKSDNTVPP